jgi:hypothetical protein
MRSYTHKRSSRTSALLICLSEGGFLVKGHAGYFVEVGASLYIILIYIL